MKKSIAGFKRCLATIAVPLSAALREGELPQRIRVLAWGSNENFKGVPVVVGKRLAVALSAAAYPFRRVALDFDHNTCPGTRAYRESNEPRVIAGYGRVELIEGDGVYLCMDSWTPEGVRSAHHYACVSAVPVTDGDTGEVMGIVSVGLCRNGAVPGMDFVGTPLSAAIPTGADEPQKEEEEEYSMDWKAFLTGALGLGPEASDDDIKAALEAALAKGKGGEPVPLSADVGALVAKAVDAAVVPLSAEVSALRGALDKRDREGAIALAKAQGKVVTLSASVVDKMTLAELNEHIKDVPVTVPLSARTPTYVSDVPAGAGPTEMQGRIASACGVDASKVWPAKK